MLISVHLLKTAGSSLREITTELKERAIAHVAERAGREQDKEDGGGLETLRRQGYM